MIIDAERAAIVELAQRVTGEMDLPDRLWLQRLQVLPRVGIAALLVLLGGAYRRSLFRWVAPQPLSLAAH